MLDAVKYGLANIANFGGRDARPTFWYYVLFAYIVNILLSVAVSAPLSISMISKTVRTAIASGGNEAAVRDATMRAVQDMTGTMMWLAIGSGVLMLVLLAASFVRRLHDANLSGFWALIPAALHLGALAMIPGNMRRLTESMVNLSEGDAMVNIKALEMQAGSTSVVSWLPIIFVVLLGIRKSTPGPNRFGETSVSF